MQPSKEQPLPPSPSKESSNSVPKNFPETKNPQAISPCNADKQHKIVDISNEKEKTTFINNKTPLENPFNLEAKIGKLKISIPSQNLPNTMYIGNKFKGHFKFQKTRTM